MTGFALLEHLQARGQHIPAVFISADEDPSTRERARALGAAYCQKPFAVPLFLQTVCSALHSPLPITI